MRLRTAQLRDFDAVSALLKRAYPTLMAASYEADALAKALPAMTNANPALLTSGTYYVVVDEGRVIGCGGWTAEKPGSQEVEPGLAHLRHFATDPDRARQGIGRRIYRQCVTDASRRGLTRFQAFASLNAEPFYQHLGLRRVEVIDIPLGPSIELASVLMEGPIAHL